MPDRDPRLADVYRQHNSEIALNYPLTVARQTYHGACALVRLVGSVACMSETL